MIKVYKLFFFFKLVIFLLLGLHFFLGTTYARYYCNNLCREQAQELLKNGHYYLDGDSDGEACERSGSCGWGGGGDSITISNNSINKNNDCGKKYKGTIYREKDDMCICPNDGDGRPTWSEKLNKCPLAKEELKTKIKNCEDNYSGTEYDQKSNSCICKNGNSRDNINYCNAKELTGKEKQKQDEQCNSKRSGTTYMTEYKGRSFDKGNCLCSDGTAYHNARGMGCSRCVEGELRNYKTKNCEVIDYKGFAQCDEKSLNFVYLNCKNNKSINFSNGTKELNPENCIKELTPKITSQGYQIVRNTLPIIFSKSCDLRYHIEPNENKKLNWIVSATNELSKFKGKEDKIESEYIKNINSLLSNQLYALNYNNDIKNLSKKNQDYKGYLHKRLCELVNKDIGVLGYSYNEICPSSKNNNIKTIYNKTEVINIVEKNGTVKKTIIQK